MSSKLILFMYILKKLSLFSLILVLIYVFFKLFNYHLEVVLFPFQLEYREGASLLLSKSFLGFEKPYSLESMPRLIDMYGFVYPLIGSTFLKFFGLKLSVLRMISFFSIILAVFYFVKINFKQNQSFILLSFLALIFYALNLFGVIPTARSDSFGFLLFILSVYIPYQRKYTQKSLVFSLLISILAFYTKSYFVIGFPFVIIYVFLFISIKRAIYFTFLFFVSLLLSLILIHLFFDFYFISIFGATFFSTTNLTSHLFNQIDFYFISLLFPFSIFIISYLLLKVIKKRELILSFLDRVPENLRFKFNLINFDSPFLILHRKINFHLFIFLLGFLLIVSKLGGHTGQFGVYLIHFLSFPFLSYLNSRFRKVDFLFIFLAISTLVLINVYRTLPLSYSRNINQLRNNRKIINYIQSNKEVLSTPLFASALVQQKKYVYLSGLTENSFYIKNFRNNHGLPSFIAKIKDKLFLEKINRCDDLTTRYVQGIEQKIKKQKFDLILSDTSIYDNWGINDSLVNIYYRKIDSMDLFLFATYQSNKVFILKPKIK